MQKNINQTQFETFLSEMLLHPTEEIKALLIKYKQSPEILSSIFFDVFKEVSKKTNPYRWQPVTPKEFLNDPYYCGKNKKTGVGVCDTMYPKLKEDFIKVHTLNSNIREVILSGSVGFGKSFFMSLGLVWNLYLLSCFKDPQGFFEISLASKIAIMIISITEKQARKNMFFDVKEMVSSISYFQENFMFDKKKATESLIFPNNIELFSGTSAQSSTIGLNIFAAALDEANFFKTIQQSKRSTTSDGEFNEAFVLYNSLQRRQDSRFLKRGCKPGTIYLGSSNVYPSDFTAQRIKSAKQNQDKTVYFIEYSRWGVCREIYGDEEFKVEIGGLNKRNRILTGDEMDVTGQVINVPMEFYEKFKSDIDSALRDIAGIALYSVCPFFANREKINEMFDTSIVRKFSVDTATLSPKTEFVLKEKILIHKIPNPKSIRFFGLDVGLKKDSFGFALGYISHMQYVEREYFDEMEQEIRTIKERVPFVVIDMVLEIVKEDDFGEVDLGRVRTLIFNLKRFGYKIKYGSADGFQSVDMMQILRKKGITMDYISMDRTTEPYECFRSAVYDNRVKCIYHPKLEIELNELEKNYVLDKVDHPKHNSSKDLADAVGSLVYNCHINPHFFDDGLLPISSNNDTMDENMNREDDCIALFEKEVRESIYPKKKKVVKNEQDII
jgi:hypothetical protein